VTHAVPVVFAGVIDPVSAGFVESLARRAKRYRFAQFEYGMNGWRELLKQIAPK
jgi:putative tryptophan/tyrosine transport system substrate-binding protein